MPQLYPPLNSSDGYIGSSDSDWATARDATTGDTVSTTVSSFTSSPSSLRYAARGGGYTYRIKRAVFMFQTTGISEDVASATLRIYGNGTSSGDIIALKGGWTIGTITTARFDDIEGWSTGSADGSGGGDNEGNVTKYSDKITTWNTSAYNDIELNAQALADMKANAAITIFLVEFDKDLKDIAPTDFTSNTVGVTFKDYTGTDRDPYIDYTYATSDNAVFFGCNF